MKTSSSFLLTFCSLIAARGVEANCRFVPIPARGEYKRNGLTSYVEVFGIRLYMSFDLDEEYLQYAANVLAGYIDNDEDGQVDDEGMLAAVDQTYCRHFYISTYEFDKGADGNGGLKAIDSDFRDSFCSISRYESSNSGTFQYSVREELHHGLAKYWDHAYPSVTGAYGSNWNEGDSELINALHDAHGNCERAADCGPTQDCTDYSCSYSENSCEWIEGSCTGVYHYAEIDCGGSCWTHEGLWHGYATIAGIYDNSYQRSNMSSEWGVFSEDAMKSNADASMLYRLLTNRAPSRSVLGYHFPTRNPRGDGTLATRPASSPDFACRATTVALSLTTIILTIMKATTTTTMTTMTMTTKAAVALAAMVQTMVRPCARIADTIEGSVPPSDAVISTAETAGAPSVRTGAKEVRAETLAITRTRTLARARTGLIPMAAMMAAMMAVALAAMVQTMVRSCARITDTIEGSAAPSDAAISTAENAGAPSVRAGAKEVRIGTLAMTLARARTGMMIPETAAIPTTANPCARITDTIEGSAAPSAAAISTEVTAGAPSETESALAAARS